MPVQLAITIVEHNIHETANGVLHRHSRLQQLPRVHLYPNALRTRKRAVEGRFNTEEQHQDWISELYPSSCYLFEGGHFQ